MTTAVAQAGEVIVSVAHAGAGVVVSQGGEVAVEQAGEVVPEVAVSVV